MPRENHGRELFDSLGVARGSQKVSSLLFRSCSAVVPQLSRSCPARCFTCEIDHAEVWFGVASPVTMTYAVGSAIAYISLVNR